jgi:hypothetical protein
VKRILLTVGAMTAVACEMSSGLTVPTSSSGKATGTTYVAAQACPSASPTTLPYAVFGHPALVQGCGGSTPSPGNVITPAFSVTPTSGVAALNVDASMCGSSATDPTITLHYAADYGDGGTDGSDKVCQFVHTYTSGGTFPLTECVWDEIPAHAPGICKTFTVSVVSCAVTFLSITPGASFCPPIAVHAQTAGVGACGLPLTISVTSDPGTPFSRFCGQITGNCSPGTTCTITGLPNCFANNNYGLTGVNATGSAVIAPNPNNCGG